MAAEIRKRILLVDDDLLVLKIYKDGLSRRGFEVEAVSDGVVALQSLRRSRPDLMVLDLMMPKFSGAEVLRFMQAEPALATVPVVVLSNSNMSDLTQEAASLGASTGLLKVSSTPAALAEVIHRVLAGESSGDERSFLLAVPAARASSGAGPAPAPASEMGGLPAPAGASPARAGAPSVEPMTSSPEPNVPTVTRLSPAPPAPATTEEPALGAETDLSAQARQDLLRRADETTATLRRLFEGISQAPTDKERHLRLQDLYRKVHFITAAAGMANCQGLAQMAHAFEALLFGMMDHPARITPSMLRTTTLAIGAFGVLFRRAHEGRPEARPGASVLVLDGDPASTRQVAAALHQAELQARSTAEPQTAWRWLHERPYDLVLLDIALPGTDSLAFRQRLRTLPGYEHTPVIFLTSQADFEARAKAGFPATDDFISKPIRPVELAVKAVMHLLHAIPS